MKIFIRFTLLSLTLLVNQFALTQAAEKQSSRVTPVTSVKVMQAEMLETTLVRGEIESPNTPRTAAKVAAEVVKVNVDDGMVVSSGQLLAELDDEAFIIAEERANADIQRLQALKENQQREVKRSKELYGKKLISQSVYDDSQTMMKQIQAELVGAKARLKEVRYKLSHTKIISPVNGVIQQRHVSIGDYVKVGNPMFHIVSMEQLRARIYLPDSLGSVIEVAMPVQLIHGEQKVDGVISALRPMMENGNRALHALVTFENQNNWKPGSSISAKIILRQLPEATVVPIKALVHRPAGIVLYKIVGNIAIEQKVTTGLKQGNRIEITSGVKIGDSIVLDGATWLSNGAIVEVKQSGI